MKKMAKKTTGQMILTNVKNWLMGILTVAFIAVFTIVGLRREVHEAMKAETLKEEVFCLDDGNDFNLAVEFGNQQSDVFIKRLYKRNGDVVQYEVKDGNVRCWLEFYSGFRIEITHLGWMLN